MQCPNCGQSIHIKREFCPHCGQRVKVQFDQIATSVRRDAAERRGHKLEQYLTWSLAVLVFIGALSVGFNYIWDQRLVYDGADLPAPGAPAVGGGAAAGLPLASHDPFRLSAPPGQTPRVFGYRFPPLRDELRTVNLGAQANASAELIRNGLRYLQGKQDKDGSWAASARDLHILKDRDESATYEWARTGVTALALMAFLGEGEAWLPNAKGQAGSYAETIKRAVAFLVRGQDPENGRFGPADGNFMYNHGIATLALAEAAGMSGDPYLRAAAQKGVDLIERTQGPKGGWDYKDRITGRQDTSVSAWQVQALAAARQAGLNVKPEALQKALDFYQAATDPLTGLVQYDFQDQKTFPSLSGVALMVRRLLGDDALSPANRALARKAGEALPRAEKAWGKDWREKPGNLDDAKRAQAFDPYAWYFTSHGLFFQGGEDWTRWSQALVAALADLQDRDGAWRANDKWGVKAGAVYATALCVLCLEAGYRIQ